MAIEASSTGSAGSTGARAGGTSSATSSSSASSSSASSSSGSTTTGTGGGACQGSIELSDDGEPTTPLTASCPGQWGSMSSSTADGYVETGGFTSAPQALVVAGCASAGPAQLVLTAAIPAMSMGYLGTSASGTVAYTDWNGETFAPIVDEDPFELVVTRWDAVPGGVGEGTFAVEADNGGTGLPRMLTGSFHVCLVADEPLP